LNLPEVFGHPSLAFHIWKEVIMVYFTTYLCANQLPILTLPNKKFYFLDKKANIPFLNGLHILHKKDKMTKNDHQ
jgi:hypothetical protein